MVELGDPSSWSLNSLHALLQIHPEASSIPPTLSKTTPTTENPIPLPQWDSIHYSETMITIETGFDASLRANKAVDFPRKYGEENYKFTENERENVSQACKIKSIDHLRKMVSLYKYL